jgi:hypothetical protein
MILHRHYVRAVPHCAPAQCRSLVSQQALINFNLFLSSALNLTTPTDSVEVAPHAGQAGELILQLR